MKVAASLIASNFLNLGAELHSIKASGADLIHLDIMDGHFAPNISLGFPAIEAVSQASNLPLDFHLMLKYPLPYVKRCLACISKFSLKSACCISVHVEVFAHDKQGLHELLSFVRDENVHCGVAINPETSLNVLNDLELWPQLDQLTIMSVQPGFSGQRFLPITLDRITQAHKAARKEGVQPQIMIDGGVGASHAPTFDNLGVDAVVMGNSFFSSKDKQALVKQLKHPRL